MKYSTLAILIFLFITSCAKHGIIIEKKIYAQDAINVCVSQIKQSTNKPISEEIDRAYVYVQDKDAWVILSRGELGMFGKRPSDYRQFISCGVTIEPIMQLIYLSVPLQYPIIDKTEKDDNKALAGSMEIMFLRHGDRFEFEQWQYFDIENFDRNNPNFSPRNDAAKMQFIQ